MSGVVTPDAVQLDFADAGIGSRAVALIIDAVVVLATLLAASIGTAAALNVSPVPDWVAVSTLLVLNLVVLFGYPIVCEVAFSGRSLGKATLGLRVVTREGAPVGFRHAAIRSAFMLVDFFVTGGAGAVLSAALTRRSQRLGDLVAGTVVLRQRHVGGSVQAAAFAVPPGAEGYAALIGPGTIDPVTYTRIRALLLRSAELDDAARDRIARRLAQPLLAVTPPPPRGMDPLTYLQVLAAVHQAGHAGTAPGPHTGVVGGPHRGDRAVSPTAIGRGAAPPGSPRGDQRRPMGTDRPPAPSADPPDGVDSGFAPPD